MILFGSIPGYHLSAPALLSEWQGERAKQEFGVGVFQPGLEGKTCAVKKHRQKRSSWV